MSLTAQGRWAVVRVCQLESLVVYAISHCRDFVLVSRRSDLLFWAGGHLKMQATFGPHE